MKNLIAIILSFTLLFQSLGLPVFAASGIPTAKQVQENGSVSSTQETHDKENKSCIPKACVTVIKKIFDKVILPTIKFVCIGGVIYLVADKAGVTGNITGVTGNIKGTNEKLNALIGELAEKIKSLDVPPVNSLITELNTQAAKIGGATTSTLEGVGFAAKTAAVVGVILLAFAVFAKFK